MICNQLRRKVTKGDNRWSEETNYARCSNDYIGLMALDAPTERECED